MPKSDHPLTGAAVSESYERVDCCANCGHCEHAYDSYYCTQDGTTEPTYHSEAPSRKERRELNRAWNAWCGDHGVDHNGHCDEYTKEKL